MFVEKNVAGFETSMGRVQGCEFGVEGIHLSDYSLYDFQLGQLVELRMSNSAVA